MLFPLHQSFKQKNSRNSLLTNSEFVRIQYLIVEFYLAPFSNFKTKNNSICERYSEINENVSNL